MLTVQITSNGINAATVIVIRVPFDTKTFHKFISKLDLRFKFYMNSVDINLVKT